VEAQRLFPYPGRSLAFSPPWREDGAAVIFDRNSGDYWVVSPLAREVVLRVATTGTQATDALVCALFDVGARETCITKMNVIDVIRELVQREILTTE